jgi:3-methyladenine DNA glycosylase/8-oxoguanine DNA glycosylase
VTTLRLPVRGPFSLAASTRFLEGFAPARYRGSSDGGPLRLAFPVEGSGETVGVAVRQEADGAVRAEVRPVVPDRTAAQLARILSLDVDGSGFPAVAGADPVVAGLAARYPGLRPVCFFSPYEAACWAVLSQRTSMIAAAAVKQRIAERFGEARDVEAVRLGAFPVPDRLRAVADDLPVPEVKRARLRALAEAALDGRLDGERLRSLPVDEALDAVRELPGMGPFSAELVVVRGAGAPDVFSESEGRLHAAMAELYGFVGASIPELAAVAERWAPYRSWVSLLIRADRERRAHASAGRTSRPGSSG